MEEIRSNSILPLQFVLFDPVHCPSLPQTRTDVPSRTYPGFWQVNVHDWPYKLLIRHEDGDTCTIPSVGGASGPHVITIQNESRQINTSYNYATQSSGIPWNQHPTCHLTYTLTCNLHHALKKEPITIPKSPYTIEGVTPNPSTVGRTFVALRLR